MFESFLATYPITDRVPATKGEVDSAATKLFEKFGGCSFDGGLYRVHSPASSLAAGEYVADAFPDYRGKLICFGFDWLGRQFSLDPDNGRRDDPEVLMFDPGTGEVLFIPVPFSVFHDQELIVAADAALAIEFYRDWRAEQGEDLHFDQCVGYEVPLFLGGVDDLENLRIIDMDVYWTISGQLRAGTRRLAPGTRIAAVTISKTE